MRTETAQPGRTRTAESVPELLIFRGNFCRLGQRMRQRLFAFELLRREHAAGVVGQLAPGHFLSKLGGSKLMRSGPSRSETFHHSVRTGAGLEPTVLKSSPDMATIISGHRSAVAMMYQTHSLLSENHACT